MTDTCISLCSSNFRPGSNQTFCTWKVFYELHHARATRGLEGPERKGESDGVDVPISWCWSLQVWFRTVLITHDIRIKRYYIWVNYGDLTWSPERDSLDGISMNFPYYFSGFSKLQYHVLYYYPIYFLPVKLWFPPPTPGLRFDSASKKSHPSFSLKVLI